MKESSRYVTNNGFVEGIAFDGMRMNLARDFDAIYVLDLGGNVRKNPKLSGTIHNVFGIQLGVSITFLIRRKKKSSTTAAIQYHAVPTDWREGREVCLSPKRDKDQWH